MTDWDNLSGDELNSKIAELRGWTLKENWDYFSWFDRAGNYICDNSDLPDVADNNCAALELAEWMKERGWNYSLGCRPNGYTVFFSKPSSKPPEQDEFASFGNPTLSLAIARAACKALESERVWWQSS